MHEIIQVNMVRKYMPLLLPYFFGHKGNEVHHQDVMSSISKQETTMIRSLHDIQVYLTCHTMIVTYGPADIFIVSLP